MIKIVKRDGTVVPYDGTKIKSAISRANYEVVNTEKVSTEDIDKIEDMIFLRAKDSDEPLHVEDIQDFIETQLIHMNKAELAKTYIKYRYKRELVRKANSTDDSILSLINLTNEEVMRENSNKAAQIASTQRDLIAGEVSKDITMRLLLPPDVVEAHKAGILHFHE